MLMLTLLAPVSAIWSQEPSVSLRRGGFLILGIVFAAYLVHQFSARELAQIVMIAGVGAGVLCILAVVFLPGLGLDNSNGYAWEGIYHAKNGLGQAALFFLSPAIAFRFNSRLMGLVKMVLAGLSLVLIIMSNAKTAWLLAPGYVLLIGVLSWSRRLRRKDALLILLGGIASLALLAVALPVLLPPLLQVLGKGEDLTGRVPLWASTLLSVAKRPLLGYGYQAFWTGLRGESLNVYMGAHFEIYQAQNGLLEIALELGLVGVALVLLTLVRAIRDALVCFQVGQSDVVNWYVGILALSVAYNVDEAFLAVCHSMPWLLYVVACTGLSIEAKKVRARLRADVSTPVIATAGMRGDAPLLPSKYT
jgi:O-antigen ligase